MEKNIIPKICHICSYFNGPIFRDLIVNQSSFTNFRVFYFSNYGSDFVNGNIPFVDKEECYYKVDRFFYFIKQNKALNAYKKLYSNSDFDFNFAHSVFTNGYVAYKIKQERNIPYIVTLQNTDLNVFFKYKLNLRKMGLQILRNAECILISSKSYMEELLSKYVPSSLVAQIKKLCKIVPYGIDNYYISNSDYSPQFIVPSNFIIMTAGRVENNKNQAFLCKSIDEYLRINPKCNITLEVIGQAKNKRLLKKIRKYPFVKYIHYMNKEKLIQHYRKADIFILLSKTETFGLVYAEALSQGVPVLYTKGQGFDKQFEEGVVGYHVSLKVSDFINKLNKLLINYSSIQRRCVNSSKKFSWDNVNALYKQIYNDVILGRNES